MTPWETVKLVPAAVILCFAVIVLFYGLIAFFEAPRIIPALRDNWREEKKLHLFGTIMDTLVSK